MRIWTKNILSCFVVWLLCNEATFSQKIIRGPYLQQLTQTSIIVRWRTDVPANSKVLFGKNKGALNLQTTDNEAVTEHIIKISGLEPDSKYYYQIWAAGLLSTSESQYFTTAGPTNSKRALRIWAGGDFGDISAPQYLQNQSAVRDAYLAATKKQDTDLWLWLGDNGYGGDRDAKLQISIFDFYKNILSHVPFAAALGNHEFDEDPANQQKSRDVHLLKITNPPTEAEAGGVPSGSKAYYSFNYGNTHFVCLDSYGLDEGLYRLYDSKGAQYQWLLKDLAANKALWTVVFFHHPPYTVRSHYSDFEQELINIRESLVPIFDRYKVDLVLNGHSHIYERSYLIEKHTGNSNTFDPSLHIVNKSTGRYQINEPPIINKDRGTIYSVVGSFGRLEGISDVQRMFNQHPTNVYSNIEIGGSLILNIDDNRLDAEWLSSNGAMLDRFTMLKQVNKKTTIQLKYGEVANLRASWPGNYVWSTGAKSRDLSVQPFKDSSFVVRDSLGFLQDIFELKVSAQPELSLSLQTSGPVCTGTNLSGTVQIKNANFADYQYKLELSDDKGDFIKPSLQTAISSPNFTIELPNNISEGINYRFRVVANSDFVKIEPSTSFPIYKPAKAGFVGDAIVPYANEVLLNLQFDGSLPIGYMINNKAYQSNKHAETVTVNPAQGLVYTLDKISNICGVGTLGIAKVSIIAPLGLEHKPFNFTLAANPVNNALLISWSEKGHAAVHISSIEGQILFKGTLKKGSNSIDVSNLPIGPYLLNVSYLHNNYSTKILKQ